MLDGSQRAAQSPSESERTASDPPAQRAARDARDARDRELVLRVAARDRSAFETLYRLYAPRVIGYLTRLVRQRDLAEGAYDDTMWVVWQKAASVRPEARVSPWVFGIAHKQGLKVRSRLGRLREQPQDCAAAPLPDCAPGAIADPEEAIARRMQLRQLSAAMDRLPAKQRAILELIFVDCHSYAEIAEITGTPVNTVKTRVFHARKKLTKLVPELFS